MARPTSCSSMRIGKSRSSSCTTAARSGPRSCSACGICWKGRTDTLYRMTARLRSTADPSARLLTTNIGGDDLVRLGQQFDRFNPLTDPGTEHLVVESGGLPQRAVI